MNSNDERGMMNDELKPKALLFPSSFIVHRSSFVLLPAPAGGSDFLSQH
jgi:hypothetical protein